MAALPNTLTDFLRNPNRILRRVDKQDIILRRTRGKPALRVSLADRAAAAGSASEMAAHLLADALGAVPEMPARLARLLEHRFPWMRFLPAGAKAEFVVEFTETLNACVSIGNTSMLEEVVGDWRATASIYADPDLAAELKRPLPGSSVRVPPPKSRAEKR